MNIKKILLLGFFAVGVLYILILSLFIRLSNNIHILDANEFEQLLIATEEPQLIDVRTPMEFKKYRIASAKNINFLSFGFRREIRKLDKTKPVMIYCHSGYRSKMVLPLLRATTVYELRGGFASWKKAGKPVE